MDGFFCGRVFSLGKLQREPFFFSTLFQFPILCVHVGSSFSTGYFVQIDTLSYFFYFLSHSYYSTDSVFLLLGIHIPPKKRRNE